MKVVDLKKAIVDLPKENKLFYKLSYNHTREYFDAESKIVSTEEAINLIDGAEFVKGTIDLCGDDNYRINSTYFEVSYMKKACYGGCGVFCICFFIIKEKEILDGINELKEPYKRIAKEIYESEVGKYLSYESILNKVGNKIISIIDKEISDNSYKLNHHFMNMEELNGLLVDKIKESEFPIDDFVFYITDDKKVLNIKHFIFNKSLEIEQWIEEIKHIDYNF